jgi:enolase 1/2/3
VIHGRDPSPPQIAERFPVWLIEDGLGEDDWDGWAALTARQGERVHLVGDDIFVTNPAIITDAISREVANAALIKVNQIGTVTGPLRPARCLAELPPGCPRGRPCPPPGHHR